MKPKSDNLFHFTKNVDIIKNILLNGFLPRYCLEDTKWLNVKQDFIAYPMVCFCDIPISRIADHTAFYGEYGLGLTKDWGLTNRLTPVIYAPAGSAVTQVTDFLFNLVYEDDPKNEDKNEALVKQIYKLITLIKPITGQMYIGGTVVEKDFSQENEWRYVPQEGGIINDASFSEKRERENEKMEKYNLALSPQDIKYIFVKSDNEIPELVDFINTRLGHFPHNAVKLLTTRILSLETITADL